MLKQVCGYCEKEFIDNPAGYENCVINCGREYRWKQAEIQKKQLAEKLDARKKELEAAQKHYEEVEASFRKDYPNEAVSRRVAPGWTVYVNGEKADEDFLNGLKTFFKNTPSWWQNV